MCTLNNRLYEPNTLFTEYPLYLATYAEFGMFAGLSPISLTVSKQNKLLRTTYDYQQNIGYLYSPAGEPKEIKVQNLLPISEKILDYIGKCF